MRAIADFTYLRAGGIVIGAALLVLVALPGAALIFDRVEPFDISDPDAEVERAYDAYERATGETVEAEVVLLVEPGTDDPDGTSAAASLAAGDLDRIDGVASIETAADNPALLADDGRSALVLGHLEADAGRVRTGERVAEAFDEREDVLAGGIAVASHQIGEQTEDDTRRIELYAAPILLLMLLFVFRSAIAAALPLALAASSIVITLALLSAIGGVVDIDLFSLQVVTGLGVGLAIDYSLFVLARYRTELHNGRTYREAHDITVATAGRTVTFGALTVAAALAALILFPQQFLSSTGIAGGIVALLSGALALTVLPATLALLGPRVAPGVEARATGEEPPPDPLSGGSRFWERLTGAVMRRPLPVATVALLAMLAIAGPAREGDLTVPDGRVLSEDRSAKQVYDATLTRFSALSRYETTVLVPVGADPDAVAAARGQIQADTGAAEVTPVRELPDGTLAVSVVSDVDPLSDEGERLLDYVRAAPWPEGTLTAGRTAELSDRSSAIAESSPLVIAVVAVTNLLLVLLMTRSLVLPLVSLLLNTLTVLASFGIMVALFQNGTTAELLGTVEQTGIDVSVPILAFAVVFGLSTDYGIFVFARISEARATAASEAEAITAGLARTGRLITSAAAIFAVAVGANVFSELVFVKEFAVAVAVAVLLDATIVRGLLVPAILRMLGPRAWWWPGGKRSGRPPPDIPDTAQV